MKKQILFSLLVLISFAAAAKDTLDVTKDIKLYLSSSLRNIHGDSVHGDYQTMQDIVNYNHNVLNDKPLNLYVPDGVKMRIDTGLVVSSNIHIIFSRKSLVLSTSLMAYNTAVFTTIGFSNVHLINLQYTNRQSQFLSAIVHFKASPYPCKNNAVIGAYIHDIWAQATLRGAYIIDEDSTYWLDSTYYVNDTIIRNFKPSHPFMLGGEDYHTDADCEGIDPGNDIKSTFITNCRIWYMGGDPIFSLGLSKAISHDSAFGRLYIRKCDLGFGNQIIEINGNYPHYIVSIDSCLLRWPQFPGGFDISAGARHLYIRDNVQKCADNGNMEIATYGTSEVTRNKCYIYRWKNTDMGYHHARTGQNRMPAVYQYGFVNDVHHNTFWTDTTGSSFSSPAEVMGVGFLATASNADSIYDKHDYGDYHGIAGGHHYHHNSWIGFTSRIIDMSQSPNKNNVFEYEYIRSKNLSGNDALFWLYGDSLIIRKCNIQVKTSGGPNDNSVGIVHKVQGNGQQVTENTFKGQPAWLKNSPGYTFR